MVKSKRSRKGLARKNSPQAHQRSPEDATKGASAGAESSKSQASTQPAGDATPGSCPPPPVEIGLMYNFLSLTSESGDLGYVEKFDFVGKDKKKARLNYPINLTAGQPQEVIWRCHQEFVLIADLFGSADYAAHFIKPPSGVVTMYKKGKGGKYVWAAVKSVHDPFGADFLNSVTLVIAPPKLKEKCSFTFSYVIVPNLVSSVAPAESPCEMKPYSSVVSRATIVLAD